MSCGRNHRKSIWKGKNGFKKGKNKEIFNFEELVISQGAGTCKCLVEA
jgi:hypothetical protein